MNGERQETRLDEIAAALSQVRPVRNGFTARCPAHDDRRNSLKVSQAADGRILIKCHAGCDTRDILAALGRTFADLFPPAGGQVVFHSSKSSSVLSFPSPSDFSAPSDSFGFSSSIAAVYSYVDESGRLLYETVRTEPKGFFQRRPDGKGGYIAGLGDVRRVLYRLDKVIEAVGRGWPVLLCEGEKDADAINDLGEDVCATTAPMGAGKWNRAYTAFLAGARVIICPDNDDAGYGHLRASGEALRLAGCTVQVAEVAKLFSQLAQVKGADVSDAIAIAGDPREVLRRILAEAEPFDWDGFEGVDRYVEGQFWADVERSSASAPVCSGIDGLDAQLGGQMYAGLYVLGAISSLGKTALMGQMALHMAAQGRKVLFYILEMGRAEMTARCLVHLLFRKDPARYVLLDVNAILHGRGEELRREVRSLGASPALRNLALLEGDIALDAEAIRQDALKHYRAFGAPPVVFVDYLQILASPDPRMGEKQAVDANLLSLKRLSRELDAPVLVVSSFNRQHYAADATFAAFKESGSIEYSADVVLALQVRGVSDLAREAKGDPSREILRRTANAAAQPVRPLELVTLKNRRGAVFGRVELDFYPGSGLFAEGKRGIDR